MSLRECLLLAVAGLLVGPLSPAAQKMAADPDVTEGVRLVETGDYDAAILTLDNAARRLAADPARVRDLSQAYLYLGIAYLGKGHEAAARAKFREALTQVRDLTLSPEEFPPKVIDLFEAARVEAMKAPASPAAQAVTSAPAPAEKKGSSKTLLLIGGVGGAAALAGIALAGGGGGESASGSSTPAPTPTPAPVTVEDLSGFLPATEGSRHFPIRVRAAGTVLAELSWTAPPGQPVELVMQLKDAAGRDLALSNRTTPSAAVLRADVVPQEYDLSVFYGPECRGCEAQFRLLVTHP
jgi:tetratricopeptide (TPR) repeat protein